MARHFGGVNQNRGGDKAKVFALAGVFVFLLLIGGVLLVYSSGEAKSPPPARVVTVEKEPEIAMVDVLVPIKNIATGQQLAPSLFRKESRPKVAVSPRAVRSFEEIQNHFAKTLIVEGQPLVREYITAVKPTSEVTARIPEGYRAISIRVDATSSVEGFARPGARVDVQWVSSMRGGSGVTTIVQNAKVLSAERQINPNAPPGAPVPSTVTLLVTSEDASRITLATATGRLTLVLRGDTDVKAMSDSTITVEDLRGGSSKGPRAACEGSVTIGQVKYCVKPGGELEPLN